MTRPDVPLIRHLARTMDLEAAGIYNRLPLFLMPEESDELLRHERDLLDSAPDTLPLPFEDFILDFPFGTKALFAQAGEAFTRGRLWARVRRRSTYIIIDPARSGDYGHPSGIRPASSGHHASPIPHARRGHIRRLAPDRKTWVRPTWVGVHEWQYDGKTYKIKTQGGTT
jgi:hypothetical protein